MNSSDGIRIGNYMPRPGLSIPLVTVLDDSGQVLEEQQRRLVRFSIQNGRGADVLFAVGTTGEWDRMDNPRRQQAAGIITDECRRCSPPGNPVEAWIGITGHTCAETLENLEFAISVNADAAVIAPLSIRDLDDPVTFVRTEMGGVFQRVGRMIPVFLYDNADIAAPGKPEHLRTADVKEMSRLDYIRGIKVTASKAVLGNYTRAASHFKLAHEFAIYAGNPHLIFDLFEPPHGIAGTVHHYWNRYLTQHSLPYGIVAGPANPMPREWRRAWEVCRAQDAALMRGYQAVLDAYRDASILADPRDGRIATIACLKTALKQLGVIESDAVAPETPVLDKASRDVFIRRFADIRAMCASTLETGWMSEYDASGVGSSAFQHG